MKNSLKAILFGLLLTASTAFAADLKTVKEQGLVGEQNNGYLGLVKGDEANIQQYVTGKSLDGLYTIIGQEERKIRQDPVGAGSDILKKVFGALK